MKTRRLMTLIVCMVALLAMPSLPLLAQEAETITVSGTLDYTPEILVNEAVGDTTFIETTENEVWSGDINGAGFAEDRITIASSGAWEAWILTTFDEVTIHGKTGSMVMLSVWKRPVATAHWQGEWVILRGTGDLANAHGGGTGWGPGFNREDPEASPDIYYWGEITFLEPASD